MPTRRPRTTTPAQYSVWLMPSAASEAPLIETIARLSVLLQSPGFQPHVTVQGDIAMPLDQLRDPVRRLAARFQPLRWSVARAETGSTYFRCLYLRFAPDATFDRLQQAMRRHTGTANGLSPYPHLSLAYGQPHPDNTGLCQTLHEEFAGQELLLDQLAIYRSAQSVPVPEWECLARFALGGH